MLPPLRLHLLRHLPCDPLLLLVLIEDRAPVLRARICSLAVLGRRVVHPVEELYQGRVGDFVGIKDDLEGFGVWEEDGVRMLA